MAANLKPVENLYAYWEVDGDESYPMLYEDLQDAAKAASDIDPVPEIGTYQLVSSSKYEVITKVQKIRKAKEK